jgi:hypothetical protein
MVRILARVNFCYCPIASKVVKIDSKIISLSQKSKSVTRSVVKWLINGRLSEAAISYLKKQTFFSDESSFKQIFEEAAVGLRQFHVPTIKLNTSNEKKLF